MSLSRIACASEPTRSRTDESSLVRLSVQWHVDLQSCWSNRGPRGEWPRGTRGFCLLARLFRRCGVRSTHLFLLNEAVSVLVVLRELFGHGVLTEASCLRNAPVTVGVERLEGRALLRGCAGSSAGGVGLCANAPESGSNAATPAAMKSLDDFMMFPCL